MLVLTGGFYSNQWGVARQGWFDGFQRGTECHVLGRLVKSRQDGMLSGGGLLGVGVSRFEKPPQPLAYGVHFRRADLASGIHIRVEGEDWPAGDQIDHQYRAYLDSLRFEIYSPYLSQNGGQGMFFSALDAALPLGSRAKLSLFHLATALLSAAALTMIVLWFASEFSLGVGVWVLASAACSQWLVGFGRNLWWGLWAFYLPFIVLCQYQSTARPRTCGRYWTLAALAFVAVLLKCFINGYEYITTTVVMLAVPSAYYALRDGTGLKALLKDALSLALGSALAIATSQAVLIGQLASLRGGAPFGFRHLAFSLAARTQGDPEDFPPSYGPSLSASRWSVLATYLKGAYVDFRGRWPELDGALPEALLAPRYGHLLVAFAAASLLAWWLGGAESPDEDNGRLRALLWTTWVALLAPLSWLVAFKAHSYEHTHMNFIVWQMPFSFFGFALCGAAGELLARRVASARLQRSAVSRTSKIP